MKIQVTKQQLLEFQRHITILIGRLNDFGDNIPYNTMVQIKNMIENREQIMIKELFDERKEKKTGEEE